MKLLTSQVELLRHGIENNPYKDHVQFIKQQAQQFRADFELERNDRLAAEERARQLHEQLVTANKRVSYFLSIVSFTYVLLSCSKHTVSIR